MISYREIGVLKQELASFTAHSELKSQARGALIKALAGQKLTAAEKAICRAAYTESLFPTRLFGVDPYRWVEKGCRSFK